MILQSSINSWKFLKVSLKFSATINAIYMYTGRGAHPVIQDRFPPLIKEHLKQAVGQVYISRSPLFYFAAYTNTVKELLYFR